MESLLEQTDKIRQKGRRWRKIRNITFLVLFSGLIIAGAIRFYCPYKEGIVSGKLRKVVYRGFVFKTYEGELVHSGLKSYDGRDSVFVFSVAKKNVAESLMRTGGKPVELHYKEYFGSIPWRGSSHNIVDEIVGITEETVIEFKELVGESNN